VSADNRRLRRLKAFGFGDGACTPVKSSVRTSAPLSFNIRYLMALLFVSATRNLPTRY
jgi:hypothetical protein